MAIVCSFIAAFVLYVVISILILCLIIHFEDGKDNILQRIDTRLLYVPKKVLLNVGTIGRFIIIMGTMFIVFLVVMNIDLTYWVRHCVNYTFSAKDSAAYSYNVVNTVSGIATPIFSFIALVVAYKTFIQDKDTNKKVLQQQKDSFEEEKDYNKKSLEKQNVSFQEEKKFNERSLLLQEEELFKNEFFNMLQTQRVILNEVSGSFSYRYSSKKGIVSGSNYFFAAKNELYSIFDVLNDKPKNKLGEKISKEFKNNISERYNLNSIKNVYLTTADDWDKICLVYETFYSKHTELSNYFCYLYQILSRIQSEKDRLTRLSANDPTKMDGVKKIIDYYLDSFRSTLTRDELVMLNYNCHLDTRLELWLLVYKNDFDKSDLYDENHFIGII